MWVATLGGLLLLGLNLFAVFFFNQEQTTFLSSTIFPIIIGLAIFMLLIVALIVSRRS